MKKLRWIPVFLMSLCLLLILMPQEDALAAEYHLPLSSWSLTSPFYRNSITYNSSTGMFTAGTYKGDSLHGGVDLAASSGTNVYAVTSGTVTYANWERKSDGGYGAGGRVLTLKGDDGNYYYYAHLNDYVVTSGRVSAGQLIAHSGTSTAGSNTGVDAHLHLSIGMASAPTAAEYQRSVNVNLGSAGWTVMKLYNKKGYITGPGYSYYSVDPETFFYLKGLRSTTTWISKSGSSSGGTITDPCTAFGCSASIGSGTYQCTSTNGLVINSEHNYDSPTGTVIPYGATVTVTKMSATGTYAHVTYNGVSGIASRNFLTKVSSSDDCTTYGCSTSDAGWYKVSGTNSPDYVLALHNAHNYNDSSQIALMPEGSKVYMTKHASSATYAHVIYNGTEGICSKNYLKKLSSYTLSFNGNGGNTPISSVTVWQEVDEFSDVSEYIPYRADYAFTGWYTAASGGTMIYDADGENVNDGTYWRNDLYVKGSGGTLYAHWERIRIPVTDVSITAFSSTLMVGSSETLSFTVSPADATCRTVTWYSSDESCCVVSPAGVVTAVGEGTSIISAYSDDDQSKSDMCVVFVTPKVDTLTLNRNVCYLTDDEPYNRTCLEAALEPLANLNIIWESGNPDVAVVSDGGVVTAVAPGRAVITASITDGPSDSCIVYVSDTMDSVLTIPYGTETIEEEAFAGVNAEIICLPNTCEMVGSRAFADNPNLKFLYMPASVWFESEDVLDNCPNVTVITKLYDYDGYVNARGIPYVNDDDAGYVPVRSVTIDSALNLSITSTAQLEALVRPALCSNRGLIWESSDPGVAVVDHEGLITAVDLGRCVITARTVDGSNITASCNVTVSLPEVTFDMVSASETPGENDCAFSASFRLQGVTEAEYIGVLLCDAHGTAVGHYLAEPSVSDGVYTVSGSVSSLMGAVLTPETDYTLYYSAVVSGYTFTSEGKAFRTTAGVPRIVISGGEQTVTAGNTISLTATILFHSSDEIIWRTSNSSVITVVNSTATTDGTASVTLRANAAGTATITARLLSDNSIAATKTITVSSNRVAVTGVTISNTSLSLTTGGSGTLTASVSPENADNKGIVWSSSNTAVATVSNGRVTAVGAGTATVYAAADDNASVRASCTVTVTAPVTVTYVSGIAIGINSASITTGSTYSLSPIVSPSDATDKSLSYASSNTSVATVSASGVVTGTGRGLATITVSAKDGSGKKATCLVAVNAACSCSTAYAGYYTVSGTDGSLNINDGHGYKTADGFTAIASIPEGARVYISAAQAAAGTSGKWGHVVYNGYSGFCSMYYLKPAQETVTGGGLHDVSSTVTITNHGVALTDNYYIYDTSSVSVTGCGYELFDASKNKISDYSQTWKTASTKWSMDVKLDGGTALSKNTTYYVQCYVNYNGSKHWGSAVKFTTSTAQVVTAPSASVMLQNLRSRASIPANRQQACYLVAEKLLNAGYSPAFTAGVIANILSEGGFGQFEYNGDSVTGKIPTSYNYSKYGGKYIYNGFNLKDVYDMAYALYNNEGGKGFGLGCMQWSFGRCINLIKEYITVIGKTTSTVTTSDTITAEQVITAEATHMFNEMQKSYGTSVNNGITSRDSRNTVDAAFYGGWSVCKNYEKPGNMYYSAGVRGAKAMEIWRAMMGM